MHIDLSTFRLKQAPRTFACCAALFAVIIGAIPSRAAATRNIRANAFSPASPEEQSKPTIHKRRVAESAVSPKVVAAEDAIDHQQYAQAETALKQATTEDPKDYRAWFDLAFVYGATNRKPEAIEAYKKSVAAKPDVFESNLNLGLMLSETHSPEAEQYLRAATKLKPQSNADEELARAWFSLGGVLKNNNQAGAVDAFAQSAKLDPTNPQPHVAAGNVLAAKGDVADAEREYQEAARLDPKSKEPVEALVDLYLKANRVADAEPALRKLLALDPNNLQAHIALSRVFIAEKKFDDAAAESNAVLKLDPNNQDAHKQALAIAIEREQYPQAIEQLRALVAQNPNNADLRYQLGNTLMRAKDFKAAQDELIAAIKLKPDRGEAYGDLAVVAAENQNYDLVLKALDLRSKLLPEVPGTFFLRASAYDHLRQPKLAAENYHRFLEVANGKYPDEEWKARHRLIAIEPKK